MRLFASLAFVVLTPVQALSLSCMPYHVEHAYMTAANSSEPYIIVSGKLDFDEAKLPRVDFNDQAATPAITRIRANIAGHAMTTKGFASKFDTPVTLVVQCFGPWCANPPAGVQHLSFLQRMKDGSFELWTNPCSGFTFAKPTAHMLQRTFACHADGVCEPPEPNR